MPARRRKTRRARKSGVSSAIIVYKFIIYLFLVAVLGTFFLKLATPIISNTAEVLGISSFFARGVDSGNSGDSDNDSDQRSSGSSGSDSSGSRSSESDSDKSRSSKASGTGGSGNTSTKTETRTSTGEDGTLRTLVETTSEDTRSEVRLSEAERIRVRSKDGRTRIDITQGGIRVRFEQRDDRVIVKAEEEDGTEVELEDEALDEIKARLAEDEISIATDGGGFSKRHFGARTHFPLSIDLSTNTLIVTTPAGTKAVAILPDKAVENILTKGILNKIGGGIASPSAGIDDGATGSAEILSESITLEEKKGGLIYKVKGLSTQRLLGLLPLDIERTVNVSAQTGVIESIEQNILSKILDIMSF